MPTPELFGAPGGLTPSFTVGGQWCTLPFGVFTLGMLTMACQQFQNQFDQLSGATKNAYSQDIAISLYNYLNQTASVAAVMNATAQELVSYFANRAEAVVPYFLNQSWSSLVYDKIATESGLVQALQGLKTAIGEQEYQDWNATVASYQGLFGHGEIYAGSGYNLLWGNPSSEPQDGNILIAYNQSATSNAVTLPWEVWSGGYFAPSGTGQSTIYFAVEPGGTVIDANINNATGTWWANWTVTDLTTGGTVPVPAVSYNSWLDETTSNIPILTKQYGWGPFDLMKATCNSGCSAASPYLETAGAYAFENTSSTAAMDYQVVNSMVPHIYVGQHNTVNTAITTLVPFPSTTAGICIPYNGVELAGSCDRPTNGTGITPSEGFATEISGGPGQVVGGNNTLTQFGLTFQHVLNNTMTLAEAYWSVLRAATDNGKYSIPADCSVPFPSDAFPAATNPALYQLSLSNTEIVYVSYLESVARWFGGTFSDTVGFCNDPDLGITFNWTSTWHLATNITASLYLGSPSGPVALNGSTDSSSSLTSPSTWPVRNVDPSLLYPFEFQLNVPVGTVYPVPANDPLAAVLVNYTGNLAYGSAPFKPQWGIPTYASLSGYGNLVQISGSRSTTGSGGTNSTGDAIYISSCIIGGTAQSTCPLSVTYFDNFTFGAIHAFVAISCGAAGTCSTGSGSGGGVGLGGNSCGFGSLNQWYDAWAGDIGSGVAEVFSYVGNLGSGVPLVGSGWSYFWSGFGCILAWVVLLVVIFLLIVYVAIPGLRKIADAWEDR